jgi:sugar (pentulose or hexulose) kinase
VLASYVASLLCGWRVPIGLDEASCTLLMNLQRGKWATKALRGIFPPGTFERLPQIVEPCRHLGNLWGYHVARHGLPESCNVSLGMGDNIAAQVTTADEPNQVSLSGGSSGTVYKEMDRATYDSTHACHVLRTAQEEFMGMFCTPHCGKFADDVRSMMHLNWAGFDAGVASPQWDNPREIIFTRSGRVIGDVPKQRAVAAVTRAILMNMKHHCAFMGQPASIVSTGGFITPPVAQMAADIFGCPVFVRPKVNRVAWGSVVMGVAKETQTPVADVVRALCPKGDCVEPDRSRAEFYRKFEEAFARAFSS